MDEKQLGNINGAGHGSELIDAGPRRESQETISPEDIEASQLDTKLPDIPPDGGYGVSRYPCVASSTFSPF